MIYTIYIYNALWLSILPVKRTLHPITSSSMSLFTQKKQKTRKCYFYCKKLLRCTIINVPPTNPPTRCTACFCLCACMYGKCYYVSQCSLCVICVYMTIVRTHRTGHENFCYCSLAKEFLINCIQAKYLNKNFFYSYVCVIVLCVQYIHM